MREKKIFLEIMNENFPHLSKVIYLLGFNLRGSMNKKKKKDKLRESHLIHIIIKLLKIKIKNKNNLKVAREKQDIL